MSNLMTTIHDPNDLQKLYNAVWRHRPEIVNELLNKGLPINHVYANGRTLAHVASWFNHGELLQVLLQKGALSSSEDEKGYTPILLAIENESLASFKVLAQTSASKAKFQDQSESPVPLNSLLLNIIQGKQTTPLHEMARKNLLPWFVWAQHHNLIKNINLQDGVGDTIGHVAAKKQNWRLLQWAVQQGLDQEIKNDLEQTVSLLNRSRLASKKSTSDSVKPLIQHSDI